MSGIEVLILMVAVFFIGIAIRMPIPFAMLSSCLAVLIFDDQITPFLILDRVISAFNSFLLLAVPFFLLSSNFMNSGGMTDRLLRLSRTLVGQLPGGLAQVNVLVSMLFAGISGSSTADSAGIGKIMIPAMKKEGYATSFSVALTACSSVMGVIFPPSIMMIIWGGVMNTSIAGLFLAGAVPGILIGLTMMLTVHIQSKRKKFGRSQPFRFSELRTSLKHSIWSIFMPVIIIGGITGGVFTPTEAAIVAALYSILVCLLIYRSLTVQRVQSVFFETSYFSGMILFNIGSASAFSWILSFYQVPQEIVSYLMALEASQVQVAFIIAGVFLVAGLFMDNIPAIIIVGAVLQPLAQASGIHDIQFAIIGIISLAYGLVTPPYGMCLLISASIGEISMLKTLWDIAILLIPMLIVLCAVIIWSEFSLWLPNMIIPQLL